MVDSRLEEKSLTSRGARVCCCFVVFSGKIERKDIFQICVGVLVFFGVYYFMFILNFQVISLQTFIQPQYNFVYINITNDSDSDSDHDDANDRLSQNSTTECPAIPPNLVGRLRVSLAEQSWEETEAELNQTNLCDGGQFRPLCRTQHRGL